MANIKKSRSFYQNGQICEMYFGLGYSINEIASRLLISIGTVVNAITLYFAKPANSIKLKSLATTEDKFIIDNWEKLNYDHIAQKLHITVWDVRQRGKSLDLPTKPQIKNKKIIANKICMLNS